ncbi:hypothetical protein ACQU0X_28920 [Pseudovibrio ascidiaceicola]|uniref:hypothetical protein n=1 Tax=Pseudovibrio ascidiaceicola TaxID=285279 RepID=UPI003D35EE60
MPYTRSDWDAAKAALNAIEEKRKALLKPTDADYETALNKLDEIEEDLPDAIGRCEGCDTPIFESDPHYKYRDDVTVCSECAPTLSSILADYQQALSLRNPDYESFGCSSLEEFKREAEACRRDLEENGDRKLLTSYVEAG